jgi:hypothetical protein
MDQDDGATAGLHPLPLATATLDLAVPHTAAPPAASVARTLLSWPLVSRLVAAAAVTHFPLALSLVAPASLLTPRWPRPLQSHPHFLTQCSAAPLPPVQHC